MRAEPLVRALCLVVVVFTLGCLSRAPAPSPEPPAAEPSTTAREPSPAHPAGPRRPTAVDPDPAADPYDRSTWKHWTDDDGDCQDTRTEVLIAESEVEVTMDASGCKVLTGRWTCPYTKQVFENPRDLDVDHRVPLRHAHEHGAAAWQAGRRRDYANDLEHPEHLVAVSARSNRSKGAKGIDAWLPEAAEQRCDYVARWMEVKRTWGLRIDAREAELAVRYAALCAQGTELPLPQKTKNLDEALGGAASGDRSCCRVCKTSQPCGDACIPRSKTCSKPPGCACAAE